MLSIHVQKHTLYTQVLLYVHMMRNDMLRYIIKGSVLHAVDVREHGDVVPAGSMVAPSVSALCRFPQRTGFPRGQ